MESVDNFEHALEVLLKSQADLLLMDINIPYLNGELLLKAKQAWSNAIGSKLARIPISFIHGSSATWQQSQSDDYDSVLVLSHFKGHPMGGYGGALKQLSIGFASSHGKTWSSINFSCFSVASLAPSYAVLHSTTVPWT